MNTYKINWRPDMIDDAMRFGDPAARPRNMAETYPNKVKADRFEVHESSSFYDIRFYIGDELTLVLCSIPVSVEKVVDEL